MAKKAPKARKGPRIIALTIQAEAESCKLLGFETQTYLFGRPHDYDECVIIRFGNSALTYAQIGIQQEYRNVINNAKAIKFNCRKSVSVRKLKNVINVPQYWVRNIPAGKTVIYRPIKHKSGGKDFKIIEAQEQTKIEKGFFASEFIKTRREFRVWFVRTKTGISILGARRYKHKKDLDKICRSEWSYRFCRVPKELARHVFLGAKALGLEFGASDTLVTKDGKYYTCEFNSCPSFDSKRIRAFFIRNLKKLVKSKFKNINTNRDNKINFIKAPEKVLTRRLKHFSINPVILNTNL